MFDIKFFAFIFEHFDVIYQLTMANAGLYRLRPLGVERQIIEDLTISVEREPKYPSEWFATNQGKSPIRVSPGANAINVAVRRTMLSRPDCLTIE